MTEKAAAETETLKQIHWNRNAKTETLKQKHWKLGWQEIGWMLGTQ